MMLNVDNLSDLVVNDIAQNLGADSPEEIEKYLPRIANMDAHTAFAKWCEWNGFGGWSSVLLTVIDELRAAETDKQA